MQNICSYIYIFNINHVYNHFIFPELKSLVSIGNLISLDDLEDLTAEEERYEDEIDSEKEDDDIKPTDNLIAVGHVYGDTSFLEVYGQLYEH